MRVAFQINRSSLFKDDPEIATSLTGWKGGADFPERSG